MASHNDGHSFKTWDKLLNPDTLKTNLARASAFLSAYELLRASIVDKPREFFLSGPCNTDKTDPKYPKYKAEVLDLWPKDILHASCLWFLHLGAITSDDVRIMEAIRRHRNDIAHELPKYLADPAHQVDVELFGSICSLLCKVDRWWIREVEILMDSDCEWPLPEDVPDDQICSTPMLVMSIIQAMFHGREADVAEMHDLLVKEWEKTRGRSVPERVIDTVRESLAEDLQAFEERAGEPVISYGEMIERLNRNGSL